GGVFERSGLPGVLSSAARSSRPQLPCPSPFTSNRDGYSFSFSVGFRSRPDASGPLLPTRRRRARRHPILLLLAVFVYVGPTRPSVSFSCRGFSSLLCAR